jgi:hypothetical protein
MSRKATEEEARRLLAMPFALTRSVRAPQNLRRTRVDDADGHHVWTFDLAINLRSADHGTESISDNYSAAVVQLPMRFDGRIGLARRGLLRNPEESSAPEIQVGTDELREKYRVRSASASLAQQVLDEPVCEWLTGPGRGFHYEIVHDRVLAYGWRRWLGGDGPRQAALGLAAQLSAGQHGASRQALQMARAAGP